MRGRNVPRHVPTSHPLIANLYWGVTQNFHSQWLPETIKHLILMLESRGGTIILTRTEPGQTKEALASLEKAVRKFNSGFLFEYHSLDEIFASTIQKQAAHFKEKLV